MKKIIFIILAISIHTSFLNSTEPSFKFTLGGSLGNIPLEFNKVSKNLKKPSGIKINSWILSPSFLSYRGNNKESEFPVSKDDKEIFFIKFNFKF